MNTVVPTMSTGPSQTTMTAHTADWLGVADLALPQHAAAVVQLLDEYAQHPMGGGAALPDAVKLNLVPALRQRSGVHVVLAFMAGQPAGMAICMEGFSTFACRPLLNLHDVVVSAAFRGQGLSKRLLAQAEAVAVGLGCCKLTMEVLEGNTVAQAAYRAGGFEGYALDPAMGRAMFWQKKLP